VSELTEAFFNLLFAKGREFVIRDIGQAFDELYNQIKGISEISVTTAVPLTKELQDYLHGKIADTRRFRGRKLHLTYNVDPRVIGGFILQSNDIKFDASIRHDLHFIKQEFIQNLYQLKY
jgi:F-type H+-transporting ATPase subunit delta